MDDAFDRKANNVWRIHELTALMPHARLEGSGVWGVHPSGAGGRLNPEEAGRRLANYLRVLVLEALLALTVILWGYGYRLF